MNCCVKISCQHDIIHWVLPVWVVIKYDCLHHYLTALHTVFAYIDPCMASITIGCVVHLD